MAECVLETRGLVKRFGRGGNAQTAVDHVSLHVEEGKVYGLLGPNGAGKSTTLKMITGMLHPTEGQMLFEGRPWTRDDLYRIGSLVEQAPLYPNLTARENLRVRTTLLGLSEARIDEALATVGLADTGSKRAGRFSMGMKQRLGAFRENFQRVIKIAGDVVTFFDFSLYFITLNLFLIPSSVTNKILSFVINIIIKYKLKSKKYKG